MTKKDNIPKALFNHNGIEIEIEQKEKDPRKEQQNQYNQKP